MQRVFVVHSQYRYDRGELVPKHDLRPAQRFGKLCFLLSDKDGQERPARVVGKLRLLLQSFTADDLLLPIGAPHFIGWATAIASLQSGGVVRQLVWSSRLHDYEIVESRLPVEPML